MRYAYSVIWAIVGVLLLVQAAALPTRGQDFAASIQLGQQEVPINQVFTIELQVKGAGIKRYQGFPDIPGLPKLGPSTARNMSFVNGHMSVSESVTMQYRPTQKGTFTIPPFTMEVNGKKLQHPGGTVTVTDAKQQRRRSPFDIFGGRSPFDDPYSQQVDPNQMEFQDLVKEDAFFAVTPSKDHVYVGEGFGLTMAFYVRLEDRQLLGFTDDLSEQLNNIVKEIRPKNCLENRVTIEVIDPTYVDIGGKKYLQYKLYQATLFPLNDEDIIIPSAKLIMNKKKFSKQRDRFDRPLYAKYEGKSYYSKARKINIKALPEHPLKDKVQVGIFELEEVLSKDEVQTGDAVSYHFVIKGQGNVPTIAAPEPKKTDKLEFYPPSIEQSERISGQYVYGAKDFKYFVEVSEPGEHRLADYLQWVYFNPSKGIYDTLTPKKVIMAAGNSKKAMTIDANAFEGVYDRIPELDNRLYSMYLDDLWGYSINLIGALLMIMTVFWTIKKYIVL